VGVLGLFDVARTMGIRKNSEDFGQTLAYWGVDSGPYMMLPIFGASSVRDSFGFLIDTAMNPIRFIDGLTAKSSLFFLREIESRAFRLPLDDVVGGSPYLFVREAYFQRRDFLIRDGASVGGFSDF
jgi:phospholipid-binding lipoprotein MlaA